MFNPVFARWLTLVGALAAALGIVLYSQLGRVAELHLGLTLLNAAAILSISVTLLGMLATLIGGVAWAREAPLVHLLLAGISAGVVAFLVTVVVNINLHGPTAVLIIVAFASAAGCLLILLIAAIRFAQERRTKELVLASFALTCLVA